ncbi:MAG: tRNA pseudouridine(55) synthase TruB [Actinomycetota bacterium]|nr:tRNA pseudouridine(55) synthase TruB [Actinomycetota bacterium]
MSRRRRSDDGPTGICIVDKPAGWTSHDVVAKARGLLGTRRVGHAGTLDPMATGVLVLGVGRATRLLTFITGVDKTYEARVTFGTETDSLDADGTVTATHDMAGLDPAAVLEAAAALTGPIEQVPPMVSAIQVDGRRLHELAREGIEVERAARPVTIRRFELTPTADPLVWDAVVECTSGTYVRSLAADLGTALGGGAHLSALRRTAVGPFDLAEASPLGEELPLLPALEGVRHLARVDVDDELAGLVRHGRVLERAQLGAEGPGPWAVVAAGDELLAVYQSHHADSAKPAIVLAAANAG